jgi:uncharacterized protein
LLFGYPPLVANVSNNIGLVGGGITGTFGYRRELAGKGRSIRRLLPASALGGVTGALLLLVLPAEAFRAIVPVLIVVGLLMVVFGPAIQRRAARRREERTAAVVAPAGAAPLGASASGTEASETEAVGASAVGVDAAGAIPAPSLARRIAIIGGVYVLGIYGGYFGAAQGVLLVGLLSVLTTEPLQSINGLKNLLTTTVNTLAAITFMVVSWHSVNWKVVLLIAGGALLGGVAGARFGRRMSPFFLRALIVIVGVIALIRLLFFN